jgi:hypothetical protein
MELNLFSAMWDGSQNIRDISRLDERANEKFLRVDRRCEQ